MARSIQDFVANFDGGARANLFEIIIRSNITSTVTLANLRFYAKSSQLPASTLGEIAVPYMGRVAKLPGDRTYEDFTVTIMNTEDMQLRKAFEEWNARINDHEVNVSIGRQENYWKSQIVEVNQLDREGSVKRIYKLQHAFPKEVGAVELAFDNNDSISEFTVTFGYTYFELG